MPSIKLAAILALLHAQAHEGEGKMTKEKHEFILKMRESEKVNGPILMSKPDLAEFLKKSQAVGNLKGNSEEDAPRVSKEDLQRRLEYYSNFNKHTQAANMYGQAQSNNAYNSGKANGYNYSSRSSNQVQGNQAQSNDAYAEASNTDQNSNWWWWSNINDNVDDMYSSNGFNSTGALEGFADLSLKYAGCTSTTSFDPDGSNGKDGSSSTAFKSNALIQYRFCPASSCSDDSWSGCKSEYGEYMMTLQDFFDTQKNLIHAEFEMLCSYCNTCYEFNKSNYCQGGNCCSHTHDCGNFDTLCSDDGDDDNDAPDYEDLFECMEVGVKSSYLRQIEQTNNYQQKNSNYKNNGGSSYYDDDSEVAYVGVHCNGMNIEVGLFADDQCSFLIATEDQVDIAGLTGVDFSTQDIEDFYIPQGCLACGGDDYNLKKNWWYAKDDKDDDNDDDYVNYMCVEMYKSSAKCNLNLSESIQEVLAESDADYENELATCAYIKAAIRGDIDELGFVTDSSMSGRTYGQSFWDSVTGVSAWEDPAYGVRMRNEVTPGQATALTVGALGTVAMAGAVYRMHQQLEIQDGASSLMAQPDKELDASSHTAIITE